MKKLILAFTAAALATPVFAGQVNIVDGDTVKIGKKTIRIVEIDTPETYQPRCEQELVKGLEAKERLRQLLDTGKITYKSAGTDRYGRTLAHVFAGDTNVGQTLIAEGHALPYKPGFNAKLERLQMWCGPSAKLDDVMVGSAKPMTLAASKKRNQDQPQGDYRGPFPNCAAARAAGAAPVYAGDPGYQPKLDRDRDGIGCE
jgi:hypothetical protein